MSEEMTSERAVEQLKTLIEDVESHRGADGSLDQVFQDDIAALKFAIEAIEAFDELGHAVLRYRRALIDGNTSAETLREAQEAVIEEIADALIMAEQLIYLEGAQGDVEKMISMKLARQVERIKAVSGE